MEESNKVKEAFDDYVTRRMHLIKALISDGNSFHRTIHAKSGIVWEVNFETLSSCVRPRLPPSTMLINFTSDPVPEYWLHSFALHCGAWLLSTAIYSEGLGKEDRGILFKKINRMPKMEDIYRKVSEMKDYEYEGNDEVDDDVFWCDSCHCYASCIIWIWCGTCQKDTFLYNCRSCSKLCKGICKSCNNACKSCSKSAIAVKCP